MTRDGNLNSEIFINKLLSGGQFQASVLGADTEGVIIFLQQTITNLSVAGTKVVSLVGGAASGKSTLALRLAERYPTNVEILCTDSFSVGTRMYRSVYFEEGDPLLKYDFELLRQIKAMILTIEPGKTITVPVYDEQSGAGVPLRSSITSLSSSSQTDFKTREITCPVDVLIIEGDFQPVNDPDLVIYLHLDDKIRLQNRITRDISRRGATDVQSITDNFNLRQQRQHVPYTLSVARTAHLLVYAKLLDDSSYNYDIFHNHTQNSSL